jgi:hypothetical protein
MRVFRGVVPDYIIVSKYTLPGTHARQAAAASSFGFSRITTTASTGMISSAGMPMETALVRLSLARTMVLQGDVEDAELQLATAGRVFSQAQARFLMQQCEHPLQESRQPP